MALEARKGVVTRVVSRKKLMVKIAGDDVAVEVSCFQDVAFAEQSIVIVHVDGPLMYVAGRL